MSEPEPDPRAGLLAVVLVPLTPPVLQKALASVYAFGKAPPHLMNWVTNDAGTDVPSLPHASSFLAPSMVRMAERPEACAIMAGVTYDGWQVWYPKNAKCQ